MKAQLLARNVFALAALMMIAGVHSASAAPITYFGWDDPRGTLTNSHAARDNFVATLSAYGTETLESHAGFAADPALNFGATGISATTDFAYIVPLAIYAVSGSKALLDAGPQAAAGEAIDDIILFNQPITAFGTYITNIGDGEANTLTFVLENTLLGTSQQVALDPLQTSVAGANATLFIGITDANPFNRIRIIESNDYDGIMYDNLIAGMVVPEPSAMTLAGVGVGLWGACAGGRRWRRVRANRDQ